MAIYWCFPCYQSIKPNGHLSSPEMVWLDKLLQSYTYICYVDVFQHPEVKKWAAELKSLRNEHSKQTAQTIVIESESAPYETAQLKLLQ